MAPETVPIPLPTMGELIALLRAKHHMSTITLGSLLGCSHTTVCRMEAGRYTVKALRVQRLCAIFGVQPAYFYPTLPARLIGLEGRLACPSPGP